MEVITDTLWHVWVEKQYYQQCPPQCNNSVLVISNSSVHVDCCSCAISCHIQCDAKSTNWNGTDSVCWVWSVLFSFPILTEAGRDVFTLPSKDLHGVLHWLPSFLPFIFVPKYSLVLFCLFLFCNNTALCCLSRWRKIYTDLYMANMFLPMLLYCIVYRLLGGKIPASVCLPSVHYRSENMWGTSTGAPVNM